MIPPPARLWSVTLDESRIKRYGEPMRGLTLLMSLPPTPTGIGSGCGASSLGFAEWRRPAERQQDEGGTDITRRTFAALALVAVTVVSVHDLHGATDELQVIRTYNVRDIVVTVLGATGEWTTGDNRFVLEFNSAPHKRLVHVGAPTLTATLPAAGDRALRASAHLEPGNVPGRYVGTITLPRTGEWSVTVAWSGAASKGSATFPVPVHTATKRAR